MFCLTKTVKRTLKSRINYLLILNIIYTFIKKTIELNSSEYKNEYISKW